MPGVDRVLGPLFVLFWSSGFLAGVFATRDVPGLSLATVRLLLAGGLLVAVPVPAGRVVGGSGATWSSRAC